MTALLSRGLYAITDSNLRGERLVESVAAALRGGAVLVQYRDKSADASRRVADARALLRLCREHGVPLIINDDVELAATIRADGVHLGRDDLSLQAARQRLGAGAILGVSCYNLPQRAVKAARAGADYVAFGRFFSSQSKPGAVAADSALLRHARQALDLPIAAIGGITADNGATLIEAGADLLAVIHGVFGQPDVTTAAQHLAQLFDGVRQRPHASSHQARKGQAS